MDACKASSGTNQVDILLDNSTIAMLNNLTGRYVYAIQGLLVNYDGIILEHPCTPGLRSRWEPKDMSDCNPTQLYSGTSQTLSNLLSNSGDRNPFMRDIHFPEEGTFCNNSDTDPEIEIVVDGECWTRVHPEHKSVFDVSTILICFFVHSIIFISTNLHWTTSSCCYHYFVYCLHLLSSSQIDFIFL